MLDAANREVTRLLSTDRSSDDECVKLRAELATSADQCRYQVAEVQARCDELQRQSHQLHEGNERLYEQLQAVMIMIGTAEIGELDWFWGTIGGKIAAARMGYK